MKFLLLLLTIFISSFGANAQHYEIEYNHTTSFDALITKAVYKLNATSEASTYYQVKSEQELKSNSEVKKANVGLIPFVKKDYLIKQVYYNQPIINKIFFVTDKLPLQTWKLSAETKQIKSFSCKKATTNFRGRKYIAWYTTDIPLIGGPWKFDGLPGLILEVVSEDGVLAIEATAINPKSVTPVPAFAYKTEDLISWKMYCQQYEKTISRIKKTMQANSESDVELSLSINLVEDISL